MRVVGVIGEFVAWAGGRERVSADGCGRASKMDHCRGALVSRWGKVAEMHVGNCVAEVRWVWIDGRAHGLVGGSKSSWTSGWRD